VGASNRSSSTTAPSLGYSLLAAVQFPILGMDFFKHFHPCWLIPLSDACRRLVYEAFSCSSREADWRWSVHRRCQGGSSSQAITGGVSRGVEGVWTAMCTRVEHHLPTGGRPVPAIYRRPGPVMHAAAKAQVEKLEKQRVVRRSSRAVGHPHYEWSARLVAFEGPVETSGD
jgi:hypothetical protein